MNFSESVMVALICMAIVFAVLGILWALIRLFSSVILIIEKRKVKNS